MGDHVLADELPHYLEPGRIQHILDGILAQLERLHAVDPHPALVPENVGISATDEITLLRTSAPRSPYVAPETQRDGTLTPASNMYSFGQIMLALLKKHEVVAGPRPKYVRIGRITATDCTSGVAGTEPADRLTATAARARIAELGWLVGAVPPFTTAFIPADRTERDLVAALRAASDDGATRGVYADWLEEHGHDSRAQFLRAELGTDAQAPRGDLLWRAVVSRARVIGTREAPCHARWDQLVGDGPEIRTCGTCRAKVRYCASADDVKLQAPSFALAAIDAGLPIDDAYAAYFSATPPQQTFNPMPIGNPPPPNWNPPVVVPPSPLPLPPMNPPAPRPEDLPPSIPNLDPVNPPAPREPDAEPADTGVLARFLGWFKRK